MNIYVKLNKLLLFRHIFIFDTEKSVCFHLHLVAFDVLDSPSVALVAFAFQRVEELIFGGKQMLTNFCFT